MIGKTISHYEILEKLGEGGMGVVYKAEDTKLKRAVALKFLHPYLTRDQETKERFIQEAQAASALDHPNICTVHEIDETKPAPADAGDEQSFIVMTYYDGETLKEKIKRERLSLNQVLEIAIQIANGLAGAHEAGIIHRDIKSSNIIITRRNEVKIIDFGLAKLSGQTGISKKGSTLGTAAYMSPEQSQGFHLDHQTDIWSFGVILYEMLSGKLPFDGEFDQVVLFKIVNQNPTPITDLNTGIPIELAEITNKAMSKSLNERYQHSDEILDDLKILKKRMEKSGEIQPLKPVKRKSPNKRYNKILLPLGIVIFLVIGFFLVRSLIFNNAHDSAPTPIAVISFNNQTGDKSYDYLSEAIPNLLITSLEQSPYLQVTTWQRMRDLLKQTENEETEVIDENLGFELCHKDGVNMIVLGSVTKAGDIFATDVKVLDVKTKNLLTSASSKGEGISSILKNQIDELSREISRSIGISEQDIKKNQRKIMEVTTSSMEAYNYFLRGKKDSYKLYYSDAVRFLHFPFA